MHIYILIKKTNFKNKTNYISWQFLCIRWRDVLQRTRWRGAASPTDSLSNGITSKNVETMRIVVLDSPQRSTKLQASTPWPCYSEKVTMRCEIFKFQIFGVCDCEGGWRLAGNTNLKVHYSSRHRGLIKKIVLMFSNLKNTWTHSLKHHTKYGKCLNIRISLIVYSSMYSWSGD